MALSANSFVPWKYEIGKVIEKNNIKKLKEYLEMGVSPDLIVIVKNEKNYPFSVSMLSAALIRNNMDIFDLLLKSGADPTALYGEVNPLKALFTYAAKHNSSLDIVTEVVNKLPNLTLRETEMFDIMGRFCWEYERPSTDLIYYVLENFIPDVNITDKKGYTMLNHALQQKTSDLSVQVALCLITHGSNLDVMNKFGKSPRTVLKQKSKKDVLGIVEKTFGITV